MSVKIDNVKEIPVVGVESKVKEPEKISSATFSELFSEADALDYALMTMGFIGALGTGASLPAFCILFGQMLDKLNGGGNIQDTVNWVVILFIIVACGNLAVSFIQVVGWTISGERQTQKFRTKYVRAMLSQEIGWFDTCGAGELSTKVADTCGKLQDGMGRRVGDVLQNGFQFLFSFIAALYLSWRLTVVLLASFPVIGCSGAFMIAAITAAQNESAGQYAKAGGLATEMLSGIRTVTALNAQPDAVTKYRRFILEAMEVGLMKGFKVGLGNGMTFCASFFTYALGFWYGAKLIADEKDAGCTSNCLSGGTVIAVFFCVIIGASSLGQLAPPLGVFFSAKAAAGGVMEVLKRKPLIDGLADTGDKPAGRPKGGIELRDVEFAYPSRPHVKVCQGYNLVIQPGETVALCGASGSGKSTIMNLLLRFYDPLEGAVFLDGTDIRSLNVRWLRNCMGYVGQEPVLFSGSIADNIAYGVDKQVDGAQDPYALRLRVEAAAKLANAHDFITAFPQGYDTDVGAGGGSMSGGQKQRIAIARALIKQPSVLLLDEATSALDAASERIVQQSIDKLQESKAQTTIIIAHRLSTIRNADRIAVVSDGRIMEIGTHDELLAKQGLYSDLVSLQMNALESLPSQASFSKLAALAEYDQVVEIVDTVTSRDKGVVDFIPAVETTRDDKMMDTKAVMGMSIESIEPLDEDKAPSKDEAKKLRNRVMGMVRHHVWWLIFGLLGAAMVGAAFPIWGLLLATVQDIFYYPDTKNLRDAGLLVATRFVMLGINCLIGYTLQYYCIAQVGQRISTVLRSEMFESFMRRDMSYFDDERNAVGTITTHLADDTRIVHEATGETFSNQLQALFTLAVGLIIGFTASWKITLVVIATFPINIAAGAMKMAELGGKQYDNEEKDVKNNEKAQEKKAKNAKMKNGKDGSTRNMNKGNSNQELDALEAVALGQAKNGGEGGLISAAFTHMRTVSAFSMQHEVAQQYSDMTIAASFKRQMRSFYSGLIFGISNAATYFCYALLFWYGSTLIVAGSINFVQMMTAMMALMLGALGLGQALSSLGDQKEGILAAKRIFSNIDEGKASSIDGLSDQGLRPEVRAKGRIELRNVFFRYPTRPGVEVCKDYSLIIEPGQVVALVGPSGSGKSTIMNLLLRFYDPLEGQVFLDGQDIKGLNVRWLRSQIGYVGQEPVLFSGSVSENIQRGRPVSGESLLSLQEVMVLENTGGCLSFLPRELQQGIKSIFSLCSGRKTIGKAVIAADVEEGHSKDGTPEDVIAASKMSYAHDFITDFPQGYATDVGESSAMVSGGQKQRIAIARALIKQPSVLLLDEATSALDAASERIVQQSIDMLQESKAQTTIIIAHRLSTIRNADKIVVIDGGEVVQEGSHDELLEMGGLYAALWAKQSGAH